MTKAPSLPSLTGQYLSTTQVNAAFEAIEEAFENTLSLDGSTPNSMQADLDMDSNDILNVNRLEAETVIVDGTDIKDLLASLPDLMTGTYTEYVAHYDGDGSTSPLVLPFNVDNPDRILLVINGQTYRPEYDYTVSGNDLIPTGDITAWPIGTKNITVRVKRETDLAAITTDDVSYESGPLTPVLDNLLPDNVYLLSDYLHPDDLDAIIAGNTSSQDGDRVTAAIRAFHEACLAALFTVDGASIVGEWPAGIYRINDRLMSDAFNNLNWSTTGFGRSRFRMRTNGNVRLRIQNWVPGRAAMRTDGPYAGSTYISPIAVFEWFQPTGLFRFAGIDGKFVIEGADSISTDPVGWYFYRLNGSRFAGELEVVNLRNRNFVWDSIFNSKADYVASRQASGVMLTEAGGSGLLTSDAVSGNVRTGLRYTVSGSSVTINTMVYDSVANTYAFTPANLFTSDHVGKWIGLDRQGRTNLVGDSPDDETDGGSSRRSVRWFQIASVTNASTAVLSATPPQQGTTGQMVAQNRTFSFEVLKCSVTAGSNIATLSMPITENLVGFEVSIPGAHYDGLPTRHPILCAMVTAHTGNTVTLSHAAGVTRTGVPFVIAPQVTIGSLSQTQFLTNSRKVDDFHVSRMWCESGQVAALPLMAQDVTNFTLGDESKLHGSPSTNNVNFGANFAAVVAGEIGGRWAGRYTHSRHSREFGMFYLTGDRSELKIDGELSSWTADDQTSIFYIDPANIATTRIWDVYVNVGDYAFGFPDASAGQVFERGGPNYVSGLVKSASSVRLPRGERPSWPPSQLGVVRAVAVGGTRDDAVSAIARGGFVPEDGVVYDIAGYRYIGVSGSTVISDLPGLEPFGIWSWIHFGAVGDGATDDGAKMLACAQAFRAYAEAVTNQMGSVVLDGGGRIYRSTVSIDFTSISTWGWKVQNTTILGECTGKAVIDAIGSRGGAWENVLVFGDQTDTPSVGFQLAPSSVGGQDGFADQNVMLHCGTRGWFSQASIILYGAESVTMEGCEWWGSNGDVPRGVFIGYSDAGFYPLASDYLTPLTGARSFINGRYNMECRYVPSGKLATVTGATATNPLTVTLSSMPFVVGETVVFGFGGIFAELYHLKAEITAISGNVLTLGSVDASGWTIPGTWPDGVIAVKAATAPAMVFARGNGHDFSNCYFVNHGGDSWVDIAYPDGAGCDGLSFENALFEGLGNEVVVRSLCGTASRSLKGLKLGTYQCAATVALIGSNASGGGNTLLQASRIEVLSTIGPVAPTLFDDPTKFAIYGGDIVVPSVQFRGNVNNLIQFTARLHTQGSNPPVLWRHNMEGGNVRSSSLGIVQGQLAGGTVTQATSKTTPVALNRIAGQIVTHNASLAAGAAAVFTFTNTEIAALDVVLAVVSSPSSKYLVTVIGVTAGQAVLRLQNLTGGALSEAVTINFAVIKGSTT